jgi:hypothetical protein
MCDYRRHQLGLKHNEVSRSRGWHWTLVADERDLEREAEMHATPFRAVVVVGCRAAEQKLTQVPLSLRIYARLYANFCRDIPRNARASGRATGIKRSKIVCVLSS